MSKQERIRKLMSDLYPECIFSLVSEDNEYYYYDWVNELENLRWKVRVAKGTYIMYYKNPMTAQWQVDHILNGAIING